MSNELQAFDIGKPQQSLEVASILQKFVKDKGLTANIQGKQYPLVEAWQFAGSQLGLIPIVKDIECLSCANPMTGDAETKYRASVEIMQLSTGNVVSRGFAICSNKEYSKKRFDEYAIASMAQTRAVGKAYRNILAWLMKAAGFEATPAEEMDFQREPEPIDFITDAERDELNRLLESSTYDEKQREGLRARIAIYDKHEQYEKAKANLMANQSGFNGVKNPSPTDVKNHVKNISRQPADV